MPVAPPPTPEKQRTGVVGNGNSGTTRYVSGQARGTNDTSVSPTPLFAMSPDAVPVENLTSYMSSPDPFLPPTVPSTRRGSLNDGSFAEFPSLTSLKSSVSEISESVFSETSAARFFEIDRKLEEFVQQAEPKLPKKEPADKIPTTIPNELKKSPYSWDCAFGWSGDEKEDIDELPKTKEAFLEKLAEAKEGTNFILTALISYQAEINSRRHHRFRAGFLNHQNAAIVITNEQLDQINAQLDSVTKEVQAINDKDIDIKKELVEAYKHAAPWIKRTQRVLYDAHVFYKLNYTLGAQNKTAKKRVIPMDIPSSSRNSS